MLLGGRGGLGSGSEYGMGGRRRPPPPGGIYGPETNPRHGNKPFKFGGLFVTPDSRPGRSGQAGPNILEVPKLIRGLGPSGHRRNATNSKEPTMVIRSTIMDTNSFRAEHADGLDPETRRLTERRDTVLGASYRLFYRNPVHLVRGEGQYLWDAAGRKYLDAYNNVASLGHCHPAVTAAVTAQMQQLNTHTRYLHENILNYTDDLLSTMPAGLNKAMYMCTGSEANDLAIRVAKAYSGGEGIIATREAYHGTSEL